ncbi:hypothetical protein HMI54_011248, partial [Coelomomyces lativittatus]
MVLIILGLCQYPNIVFDPKRFFSKVKKVAEGDTSGYFVIPENRFDFGPLPLSRTKSEKEKNAENKTLFSFTNATYQDIRVTLGLLSDKSDVFFFDLSSLDIKPQGTIFSNLSCWPKTQGRIEETIVICVKDNPEPIQFKVSGIGYKPELEMDKRNINFDKLLVGKADVREIRVRNPICVPLGLRVIGMDGLGEEFTFGPTELLLLPNQDQIFVCEFKSTKAV